MQKDYQEITMAMSVTWFQEHSAPQGSGTSPLGLHLLLGPQFDEMFGNQVRNVQEHRIAVIQAVFERN
jgi:hypothetical protein